MFAQDEAIMVLNPSPTKLWAPKGSKSRQLVNGKERGEKNRICFFGVSSNDENHCCTDNVINSETFIKSVRYLFRFHEKIALVIDPAPSHTSKKTMSYFERNKQRLIVEFLPPKSPELNPQEPDWKSVRKNVTYKLFKDKKSLGWAVKSHIRRDFSVNLNRFWG